MLNLETALSAGGAGIAPGLPHEPPEGGDLAAALIGQLRGAANAVSQGELLRALDGLTGGRAQTDLLARGPSQAAAGVSGGGFGGGGATGRWEPPGRSDTWPSGEIGRARDAAEAQLRAAIEQARTPSPPWAGLDRAGERKADDSCAPEGTAGAWVVVNRNGMSDKAEAYQQQIARTPDLPGKLMVEYSVTRANGTRATFDGCATWSGRHELLEAKYGGRALYEAAERSGSEKFKASVLQGDAEQARRQFRAVQGEQPVEWHVSDFSMLGPVQASVSRGVAEATNFTVQHTPDRGYSR